MTVLRGWSRGSLAGLAVVLLFGLAAALAPLIAPIDPLRVSESAFAGPGGRHLLGTDDLGKDIWSGLVWGARVSLLVGVLSALVATAVGVAVGAVAGYAGGATDAWLMRLTELFQVIPRFFLALVVIALFGAGLGNVVAVIALLSWPPTARSIRAEFLKLKEVEFVQAARVVGAPPTRIVLREILPAAIAPAIVLGSLGVAQAILLEAGLSFLGLGDPNSASWGLMLNNAQRFLRQSPWLAVPPGLAICLTVLAFNLVGDGLTDVLNPRLRER